MLHNLIARWLAARVWASTRHEMWKQATRHESPQNVPMLPSETASDKDEPLSAEVGFVFALPIEAAGIVDQMKSVTKTRGNGRTYHFGLFGGVRVAVVETGTGQRNAEEGTDALIKTFRPQRVISAGYAGALHGWYKKYDIVLPDRLMRLSDQDVIVIAETNASEEQTTLLTADNVIDTPKKKAALGKKYSADLVDMETFAVAQVCQKHHVPFLSVRIVLDTVRETLPRDIQHVMKSAERSRSRLTGALLRTFFSRPSSVMDLYQIREQALVATDKLAKFLTDTVKNFRT